MEDQSPSEKTAHLLKAIAHPIRLEVVLLLGEEVEVTVSTLQARFGLDQPLISHHLISMKDKGLLTIRRQGKHIYYRLAEPVIARGLATFLKSVVVQ